MRRNQVVKKVAAMGLLAGLVLATTGCATKVSASAYKTVNGVTEGDYEVSTDDIGSASFNIEGNHVEMTNFTFDADESLMVEAEINEEDVVFTHVYVHDDVDVIQNIADGHYHEVFTQENAATEFNVLYQAIFGATDEPVIDENVHFEQGVLYTGLELTDGQLFILAKNESDEFILVAVTTEEYGSQEIVDLAYDALSE